jgi:SAM-dependent methyltransferase
VTAVTARCRSCGAANLELILSLGETPLANALLTAEQRSQPEARFPLDLVFCPACALVQITETVPPEQLFSHYLYLSSFSDTMLQSAEEVANRLADRRRLGPTSLVVELASNDGYLLQYYQRRKVPVLGIEPAANVAKVAQERGIPTLVRFFGKEVAGELRDQGKTADVIHANNVLAHVADLNGFVAGIALLLKDSGVAVIEVPHVKALVEHLEFDTIYHEHLCYYSLTALKPLFQRHGLTLVDVERLPIHGGSLRFYASRTGAPSEAVRQLLAEEQVAGVAQFGFYRDFGEKVAGLRERLRNVLASLKGEGKRLAAYGASAKGSTLLNYFGINGDTLDFVVDRSTVKQGFYTPGTHLPILQTQALLERRPDYVLLLSWNFADEILAQQAAYRQQGGRFIIPIPDVKVV